MCFLGQAAFPFVGKIHQNHIIISLCERLTMLDISSSGNWVGEKKNFFFSLSSSMDRLWESHFNGPWVWISLMSLPREHHWDSHLPSELAPFHLFSFHWNHFLLNFILEFRSLTGEGNGNPLQYLCLGNHMDRRTSWATIKSMGLQRVGHDWATNSATTVAD